MYNVSILLIPLYIIITIYYIGSRRGGIVSGILIILVAILWGLLFLTQLYIPVNWIVLVTMYVLEAIILLFIGIDSVEGSTTTTYAVLSIQSIILIITSIPIAPYLLKTLGTLTISHTILIVSIGALILIPQIYGLKRKRPKL